MAAENKLKQKHAKKRAMPLNEAATKRAPLGDLQNRELAREITKDVTSKQLKDVKTSTKARADTPWKKQPLGTANGAAKARMQRLRATTTAADRSAARTTTTMTHAKHVTDAANSKLAAATTAAVAAASKQKSTADGKKTGNGGSERKSLTNVAPAPAEVAVKKKVAAASKQKSTADGKKKGNGGSERKSLTNVAPAPAEVAVKKEVAAASKQKSTADGKKKGNGDRKRKSLTNVAPAPAPAEVAVKKKVILRNNVPQAIAAVATTKTTTIVALSSRLADVEAIDAGDRKNLIMVSEYVNDIYDYLYELEEQQPIYSDHLRGQSVVSYLMRATLINWISEVNFGLDLTEDTFYLAVAIIDRYLQVVKDTKHQYMQLVGISALFIATKYEEQSSATMCDFVCVTGYTYTANEIKKMEQLILKAIDYNLSRPLPIHFLRRYSKAASADDEHHAMSEYFLELASIDYTLASYKPSEIAAASLLLSLHLLNGNARAPTGFNDSHWTPTLVHYSRYTAAHLRPITQKIAKLARNAPTATLSAAYKKYQLNQFHRIALRTELRGPLINSILVKTKKKMMNSK
ncbi:GH17968 [Drosophila grimshawi]|uniref:GH17968 n=1 Tax=Drosophila grimshawi TaxID=7222 RepID=B4JXJ6_DROGR|nr:GH17968 [Drosophila grimshawi]